MVNESDRTATGNLLEHAPSADKLRRGIIQRVGEIQSRNALLALDSVVGLLEPPHDSEISIEALLSVAQIVTGQRLFHDAVRRDRVAKAGGPRG